jgi:hypothetical protein
MAYTFLRSGRVVLVRWESVPTLADIRKVNADIAAARSAAQDRLVYTAWIPSHISEYPSANVRRAVSLNIPWLMTMCQCVNVVVEGTEVQRALKRGLVRALTIASRDPERMQVYDDNAPDKVQLHDDLQRALAHASSIAAAEVEALRLRLGSLAEVGTTS